MATEDLKPKAPPERPALQRLDSWKEIASYLKRGVRTVARWEREESLPIHRLPHKKSGSVYAFKDELDAWWNDRGHHLDQVIETELLNEAACEAPKQPEESPETGATPIPDSRRARMLQAGIAALALMMIAATATILVRRGPKPADPMVVSMEMITHDGALKESLASDGHHLYITESIGSKTAVMQSMLGNFLYSIELPFSHSQILDMTKDGANLLLKDTSQTYASGQLWIWNFLGAPPSRWASAAATRAAFSPDGTTIAFTARDAVYRGTMNGEVVKLANLSGVPESLAWSPDGVRLRISLADVNLKTSKLLEISPANGAMRELPLPSSASDRAENLITWSADGKLFFLASRQAQNSTIWVLSGSVTPMSQNDWGRFYAAPMRITGVAPVRDAPELMVLASSPANPPRLIRFDPKTDSISADLPDSAATELDFTRDGRWVAYVKYPEGSLWRCRTDGRDCLQLTRSPLEVQLPHWSPDGKQIAFTATSGAEPWRVFVVAAKGGEPKPLTPGVSDEGAPTWSADGQKLVFGQVQCATGLETCKIFEFNRRTGKLAEFESRVSLRTARWSPDGRYIAALQPGQARMLWIYDVAKREWNSVNGKASGDNLAWSPESHYLYFDDVVEPEAGIYRVNIQSQKMEMVLSFKKTCEANGVGIGWFGIAPDGTLVMPSKSYSSEVYLLRWSS